MFSTISAVVGGLGMFMLGMWLMSEGLRMAAGNTLHQLLQHWTRTRLHGLGMGFFLTALIQHSGAVTVATIGFTNAGLLTLERAIWIIFGTNIGTTVTAWLVAMIGFNFNIAAFALPLIGIGMLLKISQGEKAVAWLGQALVGFGVLFLGIDVLKDSFADLGAAISLDISTGHLATDILLFTGIGFLATVLLQSSSLMLAITMTALAGGIIGLMPAAAVVVGSNIGSTSTAIFSSFGSTAAAKRVVSSHVIFNLLTASVTLLILAPLLAILHFVQQLLVDVPAETTTLALFHTLFNLLGILLIWPIANRLVNWLEHRFISKEDELGKARYLDKHALNLPSLAMHGLVKETQRVAEMALKAAADSINFERLHPDLKKNQQYCEQIILAIGEYSHQLYKQNLPESVSEKLPVLLRINQYYAAISELAVMLNKNRGTLETTMASHIETQLNDFYKDCLSLVSAANINDSGESDITHQMDSLESNYQSLKSLLLRRGAEGTLSIARMEKLLTAISQARRICQQSMKAFNYFQNSQFETDQN
ncbi:Na/Pi cotransporter family protein [Methylophaga lonarensis]|nr:Na/Pi symporter [Methylophaga lonarensis]